MIHRDYIPGTTAKAQGMAPRGYDYWEPHWRLEDGKIIKGDKDSKEIEGLKVKIIECEVPTMKNIDVAPKQEAFFDCNKCDFKTKSEAGIKRHVTVKHKAK